MPTRNVVLPDRLAAFVDRMVAEGGYQNASEVMREGLRRLEAEADEWEKVRAKVLEGLAQVERGELAEGSGEEVMRRAFARGRSRALTGG